MYTGPGISNPLPAPSSQASQNGDETGATNQPTACFGRQISSLSPASENRSSGIESGLLTTDGKINTQQSTSNNQKDLSQNALLTTLMSSSCEHSGNQERKNINERAIQAEEFPSRVGPDKDNKPLTMKQLGQPKTVQDDDEPCKYRVITQSNKDLVEGTEWMTESSKNPCGVFKTFQNINNQYFEVIGLKKFQCKIVQANIPAKEFKVLHTGTKAEEIIEYPARYPSKDNKEGHYRLDILTSLNTLFHKRRNLPANVNLRFHFDTNQRPTTCEFGYYDYKKDSTFYSKKSLMDSQREITNTNNILKIVSTNNHVQVFIDIDQPIESTLDSEPVTHNGRFYLLLNQGFSNTINLSLSGWCTRHQDSKTSQERNPFKPLKENDNAVDINGSNSELYLPIEDENSKLVMSISAKSNDKDGWIIMGIPPTRNHNTKTKDPRIIWMGSHHTPESIRKIKENDTPSSHSRNKKPIVIGMPLNEFSSLAADHLMKTVLQRTNLKTVNSVPDGYCFYDTVSQHLKNLGITQWQMNLTHLITHLKFTTTENPNKYMKTILDEAVSLNGKKVDINKRMLLLFFHSFAVQQLATLNDVSSSLGVDDESQNEIQRTINSITGIITQCDSEDPADPKNSGSGWASDTMIKEIVLPALNDMLNPQSSIAQKEHEKKSCSAIQPKKTIEKTPETTVLPVKNEQSDGPLIMLLTTQHAESSIDTTNKITLQNFYLNNMESTVLYLRHTEEIIKSINNRSHNTLLVCHTNNNHFERLIDANAEPQSDFPLKQNSPKPSKKLKLTGTKPKNTNSLGEDERKRNNYTQVNDNQLSEIRKLAKIRYKKQAPLQAFGAGIANTSTVAMHNIIEPNTSLKSTTKILLQNPSSKDVDHLQTTHLPDTFLQAILGIQSDDNSNTQWEFCISTTKVMLKLTDDGCIYLNTINDSQENKTYKIREKQEVLTVNMLVFGEDGSAIKYLLFLTCEALEEFSKLNVTTEKQSACHQFDNHPDIDEHSPENNNKIDKFRSFMGIIPTNNESPPQAKADLTLRLSGVHAQGSANELGVREDRLNMTENDPDEVMRNALNMFLKK